MDELRRAYHDRIADLHTLTAAMVDDAATLQGQAAADDRLAVVEAEVLDLLAQQAPLARDLRVILAGLRVAQIADLCLGLAGVLSARIDSVTALLTPALGGVLDRIGVETARLLRMAGHSWRVIDEEVAGEVVVRSETSRGLQQQFLAELIGVALVPVESAVDLGLVARAYERLTDHAVEIAERVVFAATGDHLAKSRPPPSATSAMP